MNEKYIVLFSPDFKHKVDSFNLYVTNNYVKRTIALGDIYRELTRAPLIRFTGRIISSFL